MDLLAPMAPQWMPLKVGYRSPNKHGAGSPANGAFASGVQAERTILWIAGAWSFPAVPSPLTMQLTKELYRCQSPLS